MVTNWSQKLETFSDVEMACFHSLRILCIKRFPTCRKEVRMKNIKVNIYSRILNYIDIFPQESQKSGFTLAKTQNHVHNAQRIQDVDVIVTIEASPRPLSGSGTCGATLEGNRRRQHTVGQPLVSQAVLVVDLCSWDFDLDDFPITGKPSLNIHNFQVKACDREIVPLNGKYVG